MTQPRLIVEGGEPKGAPPQPMSAGRAWRLLGWAGWLFVIVGGVDSLLTWLPPSFGQPEWEFGTITASLNGLPLPVLGLVLVLVAELVEGRSLVARGVAVLMVLLALIILAMGLLYAMSVPLALRAVTEPLARQGVVKAMIKTGVQVVAYPAGLIALGLIAWTNSRSKQ